MTLRNAAAELDKLVTLLRTGKQGRPLRHIRRLYLFYLDYPTEALCQAVSRALEYGLTDLDRIEQMTLRTIAGEYFRLQINPDSQDNDDE